MKALPLTFVILVCTGCASNPKLDDYYVKTNKEINNLIDYEFATFLTDNQKALILSEPILEQSKLARKGLKSAHRRVSQEEFSLNIVQHIINQDNSGLILHGGDAVNNSCRWEFEQFNKIMNHDKNKEWYLAPGNHDGFYLGISSPNNRKNPSISGILNERRGWKDLCTPVTEMKTITGKERYNEILDKFSFVQTYAEAKGLKTLHANNANSTPPAYYSDELSLICLDDNSGLSSQKLSKVCWTSAKDNPELNGNVYGTNDSLMVKQAWRSFIVQLVRTEANGRPINILLIDTAAYSENNSAVYNNGVFKMNGFGAADNAEIVKEQQVVISRWEKELEDKDEKIDIIIGHHPLEDLDKNSRDFITNTLIKTSSKIYISGDTHHGFDALYTQNNKPVFRQANIGSTMDAPIEYAKLGISNEEKFELSRHSLTPLAKGGKTTKDKTYHFEQRYAKLDDVWNTCKDFKFPSNKTIVDDKKIKSSKHPASKTALHLIYKNNRVIDTINLYYNLYNYTNLEVPTYNDKHLTDAIQITINTSNERAHYFNEYKEEELRQTLLELSEIVETLRDGVHDDSLTNKFQLCAALVEAHEDVDKKIGSKDKPSATGF